MPLFVVQDAPDLLALYCPAGTTWKDVLRHPNAAEVLSPVQPVLTDHTWHGTDILMLAVPGQAHSVWAMWGQAGAGLQCWYVNLETPRQRTPIGFDTMDHELDLVISPDRSNWRWKDEEAFYELTTGGVFSPGEAAAIRAEGERVIAQLETDTPPAWAAWEAWSPPVDWQKPILPTNWDMKVPESLALR
jgi:hypothetical protein